MVTRAETIVTLGERAQDDVLMEQVDGILTITLHRPERRNAMTRLMIRRLIEAVDLADREDGVKAIVLTGYGTSFCAGADLSARTSLGGEYKGYDDLPPDRDAGGVLALRLFASTKPIVAAINGDAVGVGASMVLPADVRLAAHEARFGFVQSRRGIVPEGCSSWFLPRIVGISQALQWTISGELFSAEEASLAGLVSETHARSDLGAAAAEMAQRLVRHSAPLSISMTRRLLWQSLTDRHPAESHRAETVLVAGLGKTDDAREGVVSFNEKRAPRFTGSPTAQLPDLLPLLNSAEASTT